MLLELGGEGLLERLDARGGREGFGSDPLHEEGAGLCIKKMVRRRRPDQAELRARLRADELENVLRVVKAQNGARRARRFTLTDFPGSRRGDGLPGGGATAPNTALPGCRSRA